MAANTISLGVLIGSSLSSTFGNAFKSLDARAASLGKSLQKVRLGRAAFDDVLRYQKQLDSLNTGQKQFGVGNTHLWGQIAKTEAQLRAASATAEKYGVKVGDITRQNKLLILSEKSLAGQIERGNVLKANRAKRAELGGAAMGTVAAGVAVGLLVVGAVGKAGKMEADLRNTAITGGFAGTDQEKQLGRVIRAAAIDTAQSTDNLNQAVGDLVAGGIQDVSALKAYTPVMGRAATAWNVEMGDLSQLALTTRDQFGIVAEDFKAALSIMGTAGKEGMFEVKDMAKALPGLGAMLKNYGIVGQKGLAESASWLQIARMGAASSDIAANNFKNFLAKMASPDTKKDFTKAGIDLQAQQSKLIAGGKSAIEATLILIQEYIGKQGPDAAKQFKTILDSKDQAERENALQRLQEAGKLGELFQDMQAMDFIRPALANLEKMKAINAKASAAGGSNVLDTDFAANMETFNKQFDRFKISAAEVGITIGSALLPSLNSMMNTIGPLVLGFGKWAGENGKLIGAVVGLGGGLIALKLGIIATTFSWSLLTTAWTLGAGVLAFFTNGLLMTRIGLAALSVQAFAVGAAQKAMAAWTGAVTAAQWLWNAALTANPIGLVVAGIAVLGALAYTVYKNWEPIMAWFKENFGWLGTAMDKVVGMAGKVGDAMSAAGKWLTTPLWGAGSEAAPKAGKTGPVVGATVAAAMMAAPAAALPAMANKAPTTISNTTNATIHVSQLPGEDGKALAERVATYLDRKQAKDKRGALHD